MTLLFCIQTKAEECKELFYSYEAWLWCIDYVCLLMKG